MSGKLSTHVLDAANGCPARGVHLELRNLETGNLLVSQMTNADGRTDSPLLGPDEMKIGRYELLFYLGDYFKARGTALTDPPFLDRVPIHFAIADTQAGYHVPLLATPWSYTTYCGS
jgi:5-hydroxyisourate hydrolase